MSSRHVDGLCRLLLISALGAAGCGGDSADPANAENPGSGGDGDSYIPVDGDNGPGTRDGGSDTQGPGDGDTSGDGDSQTPGDGDSGDGDSGDGDGGDGEKFSFFVTSLKAMRELSGSQNGFGGDLRFGETGDGAGLRGADKICATIAEQSMPGSSAKGWRAFLSTTTVNAKDRIGSGPWYDRSGRLVASSLANLLRERPAADAVIANDLPNENGVPNHNPDGTGIVDNHDVLTATDANGNYDGGSTCSDWTSTTTTGGGGGGGFGGGLGGGFGGGGPRIGHSWPARSGNHWMFAHNTQGCGAGVNLTDQFGNGGTVGAMGGYGAIYCFALKP